MELEGLLASQLAYYRARASEYDAWFLRQGRYDRGEAHAQRWFGEVAQLERALAAFAPSGDILELACGTGWWTERLSTYGSSLTAVDAAPEVIVLNRKRLPSAGITYVQADLFSWQPARTFDTIFFSFWLSHVPPERFEGFWDTVRRCLKPNGRVFFIDSSYTPEGTARDQTLNGPDTVSVTRRLDDGQTFRYHQGLLRTGAVRGAAEGARLESFGAANRDVFLYGRTEIHG